MSFKIRFYNWALYQENSKQVEQQVETITQENFPYELWTLKYLLFSFRQSLVPLASIIISTYIVVNLCGPDRKYTVIYFHIDIITSKHSYSIGEKSVINPQIVII